MEGKDTSWGVFLGWSVAKSCYCFSLGGEKGQGEV